MSIVVAGAAQTSGARWVVKATAATRTIAAAKARIAQRSVRRSQGSEPNRTSASQYMSARSNSIIAWAGASDHSVESKVQAV